MLISKHILVVDDSTTIRRYLRGLLSRNSLAVVDEVGTAQETLRLLKSDITYDLVLLDLMLPDLDGIQLLQQIRAFNQRCAIVMITGTGGTETATLAVNQGADGYIDKQNLTMGNDSGDFLFALEQALNRREGLVAQQELQGFKADFYSMVTHDLRTPASSIALSTDLLIKGEMGPLTDEQIEVLTIANNAALKLLKLINTYLDFAKIDAGYLRLDFGTVELSSVIEESIKLTRLQAQTKSQTLTLDLPTTPVKIWADADRLKQVLDNLISNAIKYTPTGGQITVQLRAVADSQTISLRITDTGDGIAPEQLPQLFTKYHRVSNSTAPSAPGTGLGLLIVKEIVHAHGGTVEAQSAGRGHGATFTITLPLSSEPAPLP